MASSHLAGSKCLWLNIIKHQVCHAKPTFHVCVHQSCVTSYYFSQNMDKVFLLSKLWLDKSVLKDGGKSSL